MVFNGSGMIIPPYLDQGDTIGIIAPARKVTREEVEPAITLLQEWGYRVREGKNLYGAYRQFSGRDDLRASDLQECFDDPEVRAILCARGGYGSVRLIDRLDWRTLLRDPKWLIGYSDVTALHSHIHQRLGMESLHAAMPLNFRDTGNETALESLRMALQGTLRAYRVGPHALNRDGVAEGPLVGGNLSVIYSLLGSPSSPDVAGKVLFLEDLEEYLYHVDRMMMNLRRNGWLDKIAGLIVGGMTGMNDNTVPYGQSAEEIIREAMEGTGVPLAFGFPAGHIPDNRALLLGRRVRLEVGREVGLWFEG